MWVSPIFWWQKSYLLLELWAPTTETALFSCKTGFQIFHLFISWLRSTWSSSVARQHHSDISRVLWFRMRRGKISFLFWHRVWFHIWMNLALLFLYTSATNSSSGGTMMISRIQKQTSSRIKTEVRVPNMKFMTFSHHFDSLLPTVDACSWFWHLFLCYACCVYFSFLNRSECCCRLWRRARLKTSAKCFAFQFSVWLLCLHLIKIKSKAFLHFIYIFIMPNWISRLVFVLLFANSRSRCEQFSRAETKRTLNKRKIKFFGTVFYVRRFWVEQFRCCTPEWKYDKIPVSFGDLTHIQLGFHWRNFTQIN